MSEAIPDWIFEIYDITGLTLGTWKKPTFETAVVEPFRVPTAANSPRTASLYFTSPSSRWLSKHPVLHRIDPLPTHFHLVHNTANMTTTTRSAAKKQEQPPSALPAEEAQPGSKHKKEESTGTPSPKRTKKQEGDGQKTAKQKTGGYITFSPT